MAEEKEEEELDEDIEEDWDEEDIDDVFEEEEGFNLSLIPLVIGVLLTLTTVGIKFSGMDPFMGIENPSGVYGHLFLSGVAVGLIIFVIGVAMNVMSKRETPTVISEEEEVFEEEEEVEEGICPTCGAVIPLDSEECPECGEELAPPDEEEEVVEEVKECPICGAEVSADSEECPECGEPLAEEEEDEDLFAELEDI